MKRNDIVMVELPPPLGVARREQVGPRPAVVAQDDMCSLPTMLRAALTSQFVAQGFSHILRVEPSPENSLSMPSVILLFQLQVVIGAGRCA